MHFKQGQDSYFDKLHNPTKYRIVKSIKTGRALYFETEPRPIKENRCHTNRNSNKKTNSILSLNKNAT